MTEGVSYTAQISAHYADVRRRLYGPAPVARVVSIPKVPKALPPAKVAQGPVTDAHAEPFVPSPPINMLTPCSWRFLVALAARAGGVSPEEILGPSRRRPVAAARQVAIALVFQHTQNSLPGVGRLMGRDHTTVLYSLRRLNRNGKLVTLTEAANASTRIKDRNRRMGLEGMRWPDEAANG